MKLTRRQFMNMCKAVFDFEDYGIKPRLLNVHCCLCGSKYIKCRIEDQEDNEYFIRFEFNGSHDFNIYVFELIEMGFIRRVAFHNFSLNYMDSFLVLVSCSGFNFLKKRLYVGDLVRIRDGYVIPYSNSPSGFYINFLNPDPE